MVQQIVLVAQHWLDKELTQVFLETKPNRSRSALIPDTVELMLNSV